MGSGHQFKSTGWIICLQDKYFAWSVRSLLEPHALSSDTLPSPCRSKLGPARTCCHFDYRSPPRRQLLWRDSECHCDHHHINQLLLLGPTP